MGATGPPLPSSQGPAPTCCFPPSCGLGEMVGKGFELRPRPTGDLSWSQGPQRGSRVPICKEVPRDLHTGTRSVQGTWEDGTGGWG